MSDETMFSAGVHIHGIHAIEVQHTCLLAVHGDRVAQVVCFSMALVAHKERNFTIALPMQVVSLKDSHESSLLAFESLIQLGPFAQWTMDCKLSASPALCNHQECCERPWSAMLDIGLSDNSVEAHELQMQGGNLVRSSPKTDYCLFMPLWA